MKWKDVDSEAKTKLIAYLKANCEFHEDYWFKQKGKWFKRYTKEYMAWETHLGDAMRAAIEALEE